MMSVKYPRWLKLNDIIGRKIVAIRGPKTLKNAKTIQPAYIMFDDGETYIELEEQNYYAYHDCSCAAREIQTKQGKAQYDLIMDDRYYADATEDL